MVAGPAGMAGSDATRRRKEGGRMARKELRGVAYEASWLSPVGALAGALRALDVAVPPPPYLTGVSGHAFQLTLAEGPDGLMRAAPATGDSYRRAVQHYRQLGVATELLVVPPGDRAEREAAAAAIRRAIDRRRPVIAFGLQLPEFGLIYGYDEGRGQLLVSTLTTGYILDQYVVSQPDPLKTLAKLPAGVEADTRAAAASALTAVPDAQIGRAHV